VEGFFAAGECACVSVHGANRLGSNSLLECVVYGRQTGRAIANYISGRKFFSFDAQSYITAAEKTLHSLLYQSGTIRINQLRQEFQDTMTEHCGVFRTDSTMRDGLAKLQGIRAKYAQIYVDDKDCCFNTELIEALELGNLISVGEVILHSALARRESRGAHSREDYSTRDDDNFLQHTLAYHSPLGVEVNYMPVVINRFQPQERKY
jgi:succinate dehydrogenase / fumarate reductase flavoprotein subunit